MRSLLALNLRSLLCKGDLLGLVTFCLVFSFLLYILKSQLPALLMILVLRDRIPKLLDEDLHKGLFDLYVLNVGSILSCLLWKISIFLLVYGLSTVGLTMIVHYVLLGFTQFWSLLIFYALLSIIFSSIFTLCVLLTDGGNYILGNLLYPPFLIPWAMLTELFFAEKITLAAITAISALTVSSCFFLIYLTLKSDH